jgi:hypothetical protein
MQQIHGVVKVGWPTPSPRSKSSHAHAQRTSNFSATKVQQDTKKIKRIQTKAVFSSLISS